MYGSTVQSIFLLCSSISVAFGQYSINLRISSARVREGDKVEITCRVTSHLRSTVLLYWIKRDGHEEIDIGTGPHLNEWFRKTGRYRLEQNATSSMTEFKFTLHIDDAKAEDSGSIGCKIPNQNIEVFKNLTVVSQIQSVKLSSHDVDNGHAVVYVNGGNTATFNEGEVRKFNCHVNGSYPEPSVEIHIGDSNITDLFTKKVKEVYEGIQRGRYYKVDLYNDELTIGYKFSGKNLTCTARVHEPTTSGAARAYHTSEQIDPRLDPSLAWYPPVSTGVTIELKEYRPKFLCGDVFTADLHQSQVALECDLQAQPPVTGAKFSYTVLGAMNETVKDSKSFGRYRGLLVNGTDHRQKAVLKIALVFPQHFRKYFFEATNAVGTSVHEVELRRVKRGAVSEAPGASGYCGIGLLLLSVISISVVNLVLN